MFQSGSAKLELIETYASGDLVVLVTSNETTELWAVCRSRTGRSG